MRYRRLGASDLHVSEISLGSWLTYGSGIETERAVGCVRKAFEVGINFIDTANVYGRGAAETFLGEVLSGVDRSSYILATKAYFPMTSEDRGLSAVQVHKQCEASLRRLRTDYVDLYQCHRYDRETPLEETMGALTDLVRAGKTRYLGFSEWTADQVRAALALPGTERFVSSQPEYSMLWRKPEAEIIPLCAREGIGQIVWSPLAQGILTGKYRAGSPPPPDSRAAHGRMGSQMGRWRDDDVLAAVDRLRPIAGRLGLPMAHLALAWVLREPNVASAITGASRPEQVEQNAAASGTTLDDDVLKAVDEAVGDAVGP
ncbi:MAG TPA: aldo/keto reductase family protein [Acidimicrobiales bacterium]|nr:aldo/keto reductase family protein [Acidimicrobiales bacterium]